LDGAPADISVLVRRLHALRAVSLVLCVSVPALLQLWRSSVAAADISDLVRRHVSPRLRSSVCWHMLTYADVC
jgi:hypothetical protein